MMLSFQGTEKKEFDTWKAGRGGGLKAYHPKPSKTDTLQSFYTQSATQPGADLACGFSVVLLCNTLAALDCTARLLP